MPRLKPMSLGLLFPLLLLSCKSTRPTVEIQDRTIAQPTVISATDTDAIAATTLKISSLNLPFGAKSYSRISLTLASEGLPVTNLDDYALNDKIPLKPNCTYSLTVRAYAAGVLLYSNEYCPGGKDFNAKVGSNNYTVPLCAVPAEGDLEENIPKPTLPSIPGSSMREVPPLPDSPGATIP